MKENNNNPITKAKNAEHSFKKGHKLWETLSEEKKQKVLEAAAAAGAKGRQTMHERAVKLREEHPEIIAEREARKKEWFDIHREELNRKERDKRANETPEEKEARRAKARARYHEKKRINEVIELDFIGFSGNRTQKSD